METNPLPLFLLKSVLLPHMPLRLHVFEERYKRMIDLCLEAKRPFGVALIREGNEVGPPAVPEAVGCLARIVAVQRLDEGRMNLFAEGTERFRLLDYMEEEVLLNPTRGSGERSETGEMLELESERYLVGFTEPIVDTPASADGTGPLIVRIAKQFAQYFRILADYSGIEMPEYDLPTSPLELSFVIAAVVQMEASKRQQLLELTDTSARLTIEREILSRELRRLTKMTRSSPRIAEKIAKSDLKAFYSPN